jgi:hypothetical protein
MKSQWDFRTGLTDERRARRWMSLRQVLGGSPTYSLVCKRGAILFEIEKAKGELHG